MSLTSDKIALVEKLPDSRTAHLQPVIDFLKALGNEPANGDEFVFNRDGYGEYLFRQPLPVAQLREQFTFPSTITLTGTAVEDTRNFVAINQASVPGPPLIFQL
ncbi:hypothetical protein [Hymenobacter sp. YC55]|uniref:hypothetical protein n=1 Tax=Hymenobacter sp. YC55 TaxID=3034019 RepID=UPI0023F7427F|nr:hypothetical protein [Hymenobacter sp. YC55]MDF7814172.1 hypothetical protein [Hymenobacter sp. YC55]